MIDGCDPDDDNDDVPDECDPDSTGGFDCDANGIDDVCELGDDCNSNLIPDRCESDLDEDGVIDACDPDDDNDGIPDECDPRSTGGEDCDFNGVDDSCEPDLDQDGIIDACDDDDDGDGIPDDCDVDSAAESSPFPGARYWSPSEGGNGHWYAAIESPAITWFDAHEQAEQMGGHLATLTSALENQHMLQLVPQIQVESGNGYWIGARSGLEGQFEWVTGEPFDYTSWGAASVTINLTDEMPLTCTASMKMDSQLGQMTILIG